MIKRRRRYFEEAKDPADGGSASAPAPEDVTGAPAPADDAAVTHPPAPEGGEKANAEEDAIAGFLKGVEDVSPHLKSEEDKPADAKPAPKDDKKDAAAPAPAPAPATPERDKDLDAEVKTLGLKGAAEKRFRDMAGEIKASRPYVESLKKVGIESQQDLDNVLQASARGMEWEQAIERSTATGEQVGSAFTVIRAMNTGDPVLMNAAYDALVEQVTALGTRLGRELPGGSVDPLAAHKDLLEGVDNLEITRERALEIARFRAAEKLTKDQRDNANRASETSKQQEEAYAVAEADGKKALNEFDQECRANDPQAAVKLPILVQMIQNGMLKDVHPSKWAEKTAREYLKIKVAAAPAPAPRRAPAVGSQPIRGGAGPTATLDNNDQSGVNPFMRGVAAVSADR